MPVEVRDIRQEERDNWDRFVASEPDARLFHATGWCDLLARNFPYKDRSLIAWNGSTVVGVLPLMQVNSPLTGKALISSPLCTSCGPLAASSEAGRALVLAAHDMAVRERVRYLELRDMDSDFLPDSVHWHAPQQYSFFRRDLPDDPEAVIKEIPYRERALIRRGEDNKLNAEIDNDLEVFHRLHCLTVRGHGTPPYAKRYFEDLLRTFPDNVEILTVRGPTGPLCAAMCFRTRKEVTPYYVGARLEARKVGGFPFMYHAMMKFAAGRGIPYAEMGRSPTGSGSYLFKKNLGFTPRPDGYQIFAENPAAIPDIASDNPRLKPVLAVWRSLPIPLTVLIGSRVAWMAP